MHSMDLHGYQAKPSRFLQRAAVFRAQGDRPWLREALALSFGVALSIASSWPFRLCGVDITASTESELENVTKPMPRWDCLDASLGM